MGYHKSSMKSCKQLYFTVRVCLTSRHFSAHLGVGVDKGGLVTPGHKDDQQRGSVKWGEPTDFLDVVHKHGLKAHCFTFRNEWMKLYWDHGQDPYSQLEEFLDLGTDGYFSDFPLSARRFLHYKNKLCSSSATGSTALLLLPLLVGTQLLSF